MNDLISRQAAILAIRRTAEPLYRGEDNVILAEYEDAIMELPTIDPVRHGKWLPHPTEPDWDVCSVCRLVTHRRFHYNDGVYGGYDVEESFAYCSRCGAKMDGGKI